MPYSVEQDGASVHGLCSLASDNETVSDLPGPGRTLGKAYKFLGRKLEGGLGKAKTYHWLPHVPALHDTMDNSAEPPGISPDGVYNLCSLPSSNETASNLPGPGRMLGNFYGFLGRRLGIGMSRAAERMGYGPRVVAMRIQRTWESPALDLARRRKLKKNCIRLARYVW